jgi:Zn-dependent protease
MQEMIQTVAIAALPVILAITLHEAAHGYAARYFGDPTAWQEGRITANPLKHIDPVGTILVPIDHSAAVFRRRHPVRLGQAGAGQFRPLRHPKQDMLWVAAAGPAANLACCCSGRR